MVNNKTTLIADSEGAYADLKVITDAAQAGILKRWSPAVIKLLESYGISVKRKKGITAQVTLSFPESQEPRSMAIGVRYMKDSENFAEDLFLFEEGIGLTKFYRGTQEKILTEYEGTHHARMEISEFLPDIQEEINAIKTKIAVGGILDSIPVTSIFSEAELKIQLDALSNELAQKVHSLKIAHPYAPIDRLSQAVYQEGNKERQIIRDKYFKSEKLYNLKKAQLGELFKNDEATFKVQLTILDNLFDRHSKTV